MSQLLRYWHARPALRELGHRVHQRRKALGLSRRQLAQRSDVWSPQVWLLERGLKSGPVEKLVLVATALELDSSELVRGLGVMFRDVVPG
ncbi:helix-turn-helix domain-containing protein [Amycolatopsis dongchuanensis]|uniref:HTH cro/C1-type domain-containing protein n=1 Tax=Amycolatopsis dongchuanensis TaxID=1070866 RepID=A0ABP8VHQ7_9PSEU